MRAAIVFHATRGRTRSARAVRAEEVEAVREAFRALTDGQLAASNVEGTVMLVPPEASAA